MANPVPTVPGALATVEDFMLRFPEQVKDTEQTLLGDYLVEATAHIEDLTSRRLAPFTNLVYSGMLYGISQDEYGSTDSNMPLSFAGSLGANYADALGTSDLVRNFWLDQFAPTYQELWTYDIQSVNLFLTYGNTINVPLSNLIGDSPEVNTGYCRLQIGTFAPIGTRIQVVYNGGYTVAIPPSLKRACLYQALKFVQLDAEPMMSRGLDTTELDGQIRNLLLPWFRG